MTARRIRCVLLAGTQAAFPIVCGAQSTRAPYAGDVVGCFPPPIPPTRNPSHTASAVCVGWCPSSWWPSCVLRRYVTVHSRMRRLCWTLHELCGPCTSTCPSHLGVAAGC
jgi:hypothetical protein